MSQQNAVQQASHTVNGIEIGVLKETVQAIMDDPSLGQCHFRATNRWIDANRNSSTVSEFYGAGQVNQHKQAFEFHADEPPVLAGSDEAANPVEHLLHALASCVTTSMVAHAAVRGIDIEELESSLEGDIDLRGFLGIAPNVPKGYTEIRVNFRVKSNATSEQLRQLAEFSPVYNTLIHGTRVNIQIDEKQ